MEKINIWKKIVVWDEKRVKNYTQFEEFLFDCPSDSFSTFFSNFFQNF